MHNLKILESLQEEEKDLQHKLSEHPGRVLVFGRYFARIPRYINRMSKALTKLKPIQHVKRFGLPIKLTFPMMDKPLFALAIGSIGYDIYHDYLKVKNENSVFKTFFLMDRVIWNLLRSFVFSTIFISNSMYAFIYLAGKCTSNPTAIKLLSIGFSIFLITYCLHHIDGFTTFFMDNTYRKVIDYRQISRDYEIEPECCLI
jgi:hypothetical protein